MQTFLRASGPRAMLLAGAISAVLPLSGFAQTYDAVAQFNTSGVQSIGAVWTYGTETSLNSGFSLLPSYQSNVSCSVLPSGEAGTCAPSSQQFSDYYLAIPFYGPEIAKNTSASPTTITFTVAGPSLIWPSNFLNIAPACGSQVAPPLSVVRWTAPAAGTYNIAGTFANLQEASTPVYVSINGVAAFSNTSALNGAEAVGSTVGFSGGALSNVSLAAGDAVDFVVASVGINSGNCSVGLSATISTAQTACNGLPQIIGVNVQSIHGLNNGTFFDGSLYHYGLGSQDPSDPPNCTYDGYVFEEVFILSASCPFTPHRGFVSGLQIEHGSDPSSFGSWIPDILAAPRLNPPLSSSCVSVASQILNWISPTQGNISLTNTNTHVLEITIDPVNGSTITTTSFAVQNTTTYGP